MGANTSVFLQLAFTLKEALFVKKSRMSKKVVKDTFIVILKFICCLRTYVTLQTRHQTHATIRSDRISILTGFSTGLVSES